jgi:hypothetical protein
MVFPVLMCGVMIGWLAAAGGGGGGRGRLADLKSVQVLPKPVLLTKLLNNSFTCAELVV